MHRGRRSLWANPREIHAQKRYALPGCVYRHLLGVTCARHSEHNHPPGSPAYLDSLDGFRGVKFGTEFGKFTGLVLDQDRGKLKLYTKKSEDLTLGLAKLSAIVYHFFDGKLQAVTIHTTSMPDGRTLTAIANSASAPGQSSIRTIRSGRARPPGPSSRRMNRRAR